MLVKDQLHRVLNIPSTLRRIISLVPSQTELLVDLGLEDHIVGITKFCVHPKHLRKEKIVVGGTKKVDYKKIAALRPDIIICNKEENTKEMVIALEAIAPVWVSDICSLDTALAMIRDLGKLLDVSERASQLTTNILNARDVFQNSLKSNKKKSVAYVIWKNPWMLAGRDTFINHLLELNNFENIVEEESSRYPEVSSDFLKKADIVYLSTEPFPFSEEDVIEIKDRLQVEVRLVDGEYFSWYGSRLEKAFEYFKTLQ